MTLDEAEAALARLLTDPTWRDALFEAGEHEHARSGLSARVFALMRDLDRRRLHVTSEGFQGKRFERIASAFPRALALLDTHAPAARGDYLARTPFPESAEAERSYFQRIAPTLVKERDAELARLLADVTDAELAAYNLAPGDRVALTVRADLPRVFDALPARPPAYAEAPMRVDVTRTGAGIRVTLSAASMLPTMISRCSHSSSEDHHVRDPFHPTH